LDGGREEERGREREIATFSPSLFLVGRPGRRAQVRRARLPALEAGAGAEERRAAAEAERRFFPSATAFVIAHYADDVEYRCT
jgi:hypothetical protein